MTEEDSAVAIGHKKRDETFAFLFLAFVLFPVLAVVIVGGFGFIVWMQHLMFGPPGI